MIRQLFDSNIQFQLKDGSINVGGYLNVYFNVGTVKAVTYKDADALTVNPFNIELDNNGRAVVYADNAYVYRMEVFDRNKNLLWTQNNISLDSGIAIDGTYVMSIKGDQFISVDSSTSGNAVEYALSLNDYAVDSINLVNDNTFGNSALYNSIQSTSAHLDNKIDNLDIHNISIEQSGDGNAYTSFTKNGDVYTFNKGATYLPSANAPVVIAGENVEVSSANINGQMQYTVKANPAGNVTNLISTDETISISATSAGNDVTYDLSVKGLGGDAAYAFLGVDDYPLTANHFGGIIFDNYTTKGITWSTVDNRLEIPSTIKLIDVNVECELLLSNINNVSYGNLLLGIYQDWGLLEEKTIEIDLSKERHFVNFTTKMLDVENLQFTIKSPANGTANIRISVNDESNTIVGGGGGTTYYAGLNIKISDNVISGRDWTPELNNKLDTSAFTAPTAGNGISITNDEISVNAGKGLGFDVDKKLEVKVGDGLAYDAENKVITVVSDVSDVVETVEKLKEDLDTKLTVNFDISNITHTFDFADSSVTTLSNGATLLCQAFTVQINTGIRISNEQEDPTLIGIYSKQSYGSKIMLAIYVYDFDTGYTEYVADTGPVMVAAGRNEFPIKHINNNISELKSNCVYYAALYLPSSHGSGLYLASCQSYSNASYINATPRFTVGVQNITYNGSEISLADDTTGRLDYNDGLGNYYIGPWSDGYNEIPSAPRFFMHLRNGKVEEPVVVEPFDNISTYTVSAKTIDSLFTTASELGAASMPVVYREVTPLRDITINWWQSWSPEATDNNKFGAVIYSTGFNNIIYDKANVTVTDLGQSDGLYARKYTLNSTITLLAGVTYRFPVWLGNYNYTANCITYDTPATSTVLHLFQSAWTINERASYKRLNDVAAMPLILHDTDNNTYRI